MPYFNDSMFSNQLDVRRGTLYQRPGPPTPSKNGGRLSFGGSNVTASDLFPKEVLREQNNNAKTKTTPGKLMSMFSSKHKEVRFLPIIFVFMDFVSVMVSKIVMLLTLISHKFH